jgi:putative heme-binding domain-containing protein
MPHGRFFLLAGLLLFVTLCLSADGPAAEKWADDRLPAVEGLELWLDAGRVQAARQARGEALLKPGDALPAWPDASGHGRHVTQPRKEAQPRLVQIGDHWVVRFDGLDDHLRLTGLNKALEAFTVFLVAAPHDNPGDFRAFLAGNETGKRDYETGFTIDLSAGPGLQFDQVNVEGRGFGGARDLLDAASPFGTLHVLEAVADSAAKKVRLWFDGKLAGERPFQPGPLRLDEITVGARYFTNGPGAQQVRGFLPGDIAEVLVFNRVLSDEEVKKVRPYLEKKHAKLKETLPATLNLKTAGEPLVHVPDPPPVQMLVPGFRVRQLPLDLTNINNLKYRPDGKLVALAYNGNVFLLSDTNGDGLEDKADLFWENKGSLRGPIGLALTPPRYPHGNGVFVPSKGKLSLIVDTDGDDKADKETVVAQGWKEIPQAVDAVGVALDTNGNIYFALGTANYANGYLLDKEGKAAFDLKSERGTVQKVSPDFKKRETVCTGVRFPVAMAFNRAGDLFCSDQEGATWLPNGNPFDELLHIQPGRHYGFPPRHPKHLPGVIDEPSVFDYGPQHQSTCGLNFNESVNGGPTFGPASWAGDALICGESRGKLYRTKLVKTPSGYVAQNHLFACLNMLTVDACVSPKGDLVVAAHSGPPDWGTGPGGKGKLYKISYSDPEHPQPVAVWAAGPQEVRIAFDRPLNPEHLKQLAAQTKISYGPYVRAGDRFESLRPPYQVVVMQLRTPRYDLPVYSAQMTADRRTLVLTTAAMRDAVYYAATLPGMGRPTKERAGELPQHPQIDLDYQLTGVAATWQPKAGGASWSGWLPHLDLAVASAFTQGSAAHETLRQGLKGPGTLTLRTQLNLTDMLRPAVQPGSQIDHEWPAEQVTLTFRSPGAFRLRVVPDGKPVEAAQAEGGQFQARLTVSPKPNQSVPLEMVLSAGERAPSLTVSWHTAEDERPRALPIHRLLLPWVKPGAPSQGAVVERNIPELKGGSWSRGRKVFLSEEAACAKCHALHGQGAAIGPDLSNLVHRDYDSVLRDLAEPSFTLNPDYLPYLVTLKDGRVLTGSLRTEGDKLLIGDDKGQVTAVKRNEVAELAPAAKSTMPEGLPKTLGPERLRDLMTFLLTEPPHMPRDWKGTPPAPRSRAEVQAVLAGAPNPPAKTRPIHVVLVAGKKDHGPGEHDYPWWAERWEPLLGKAAQVDVKAVLKWPAPEDWAWADVAVLYQWGKYDAAKLKDLGDFGKGLVFVHSATITQELAPILGLSGGRLMKFRHGELELSLEPHSITEGLPKKIKFHDETYWPLVKDGQVETIGSAVEEGKAWPMIWTRGRNIVGCVLGHYSWSFEDPYFRLLLLRSIAWAAGEPVHRFDPLAGEGVLFK